MNVAYNMDCLEAMRTMPDNAFDLAVVDPPYGSGLTETGGCKGWFSKYHQDPADNLGGVEPLRAMVRPLQEYRGGVARQNVLTTPSGSGKPQRITRVGGTWAEKYQKNHLVGRRPGKGILRRTFPRLTEPDYLGGQLLRPSSNEVLHHLQEDKHSRKRVQHGTR